MDASYIVVYPNRILTCLHAHTSHERLLGSSYSFPQKRLILEARQDKHNPMGRRYYILILIHTKFCLEKKDTHTRWHLVWGSIHKTCY
jgi:hypothetical protein